MLVKRLSCVQACKELWTTASYDERHGTASGGGVRLAYPATAIDVGSKHTSRSCTSRQPVKLNLSKSNSCSDLAAFCSQSKCDTANIAGQQEPVLEIRTADASGCICGLV